MAGLEFLRGGWEADIARIIEALPYSGPDRVLADEAGRVIVRSLSAFPGQDLFEAKKGRRALREFSLCDKEGRSFRMDRLIIEGARAAVIDFKTGADAGSSGSMERQDNDREQVRVYQKLIEEAMPGLKASGLLIYLDQGRWEDVT